MAQFQKEELFGPAKGGTVGSVSDGSKKSTAEFASPTQNMGKIEPQPSLLRDLADWTRQHKRLALVGAFGIGVFLGVLTRR